MNSIFKYKLWVWLHRHCGLAIAGFLLVAGLTGSLLAFNMELEHVFAPQLFAKPQTEKPTLDLATLAERIQSAVPRAELRGVAYTNSDQVQAYFVPLRNPATGQLYDLGFDEFYLDPWTGKELGRRRRGDLSQGLVNVMPFFYRLHWTLLAGTPGQYVLGGVALIWSIDCFIAFYLTLPRSTGPFWSRWFRAWQVQYSASTFRLNFDLHRASGLWVWPALFVFAWSSVMMNIRPAYEKVMSEIFDYRSPREVFASVAIRNDSPKLDWRSAQAVGAKLMAEQTRKLCWRRSVRVPFPRADQRQAANSGWRHWRALAGGSLIDKPHGSPAQGLRFALPTVR